MTVYVQILLMWNIEPSKLINKINSYFKSSSKAKQHFILIVLCNTSLVLLLYQYSVIAVGVYFLK